MITRFQEIVTYIYSWLKSFIQKKETTRYLFSKDYLFGNLALVEYGYPGVVDWSSTLARTDSQKKQPSKYLKHSPGVWVLTPREGKYTYIMVLINVASYKSTKQFKLSAPTEWTEVFESKIKEHMDTKHRATHLFIDLWVSKDKISFKRFKNKLVPTYKVFTKNALLLDLQGYKEFAPAGDVFAKKIFTEYIRKLINIKFKGSTLNWESIVQQINSRQWLDILGRQYLGEDHVTVRN